MAGPLEAAGALPEPSEYATLTMDRHITGLWTQRSPLRDADVPYLYGKFYSASRFDSLIDGINREVTAKLTDARRAGSSVYNSSTFPAINSFYSYKSILGGIEVIRVIADGQDGWIYDATAGQQTKLLQKPVATAKARFLGMITELLVSDGANLQAKVSWQSGSPVVSNWGGVGPTKAPLVANVPLPSPYPAWLANTWFSPPNGYVILDPNSNIQNLTTSGTTGTSQPTWNTTVNGVTNDGTCQWTNTGPSTWQANHAYPVGAYMQRTWTEVINVGTSYYGGGPNYQYIQRNYGFRVVIAGTSGPTVPMKPAPDGSTEEAWGSGIGSVTIDGGVTWQNIGNLHGWPGAGKTIEVVNQIVDSNGNLESVVTAGQSGATAPTWSKTTGAQTIDNGVVWQNAGPVSAPGTGAWIYCYAFKSSTTKDVSTASPQSQPIVLAASSYVQVQGQGSSDPQYDTIEIYRTAMGQATMVLLADITNPGAGQVWTYNDTSGSDNVLTAQVSAPINHANDPPPAGITAMTFHAGRVWGIVGNTIVYSGGPDTLVGNGNHTFPPLNTIPLPELGVRLFPGVSNQGATLYIWAVANVYTVFGDGANTKFGPAVLYMGDVGILSYDAVTLVGSTYYAFTGKKKGISLDPGSGYVEIGFPIGDQFINVTTGAGSGPTGSLYNPASSYVTFNEQSSGDTALYVADGAVGWFRFSPVSSPESGFLWSPRAGIVGGTSAVQSVEVSPGVNKLLIAPKTSGPILMRDMTVNADWNAGAYVNFSSWDVKGNIVLCQSGQVAEIAHIGLKSAAVGARPLVALLLGEVMPTQHTPFDQLSITSSDPPDLPPSETMYSDRYTALQNGVCPKCDNFQMKVDYGSQNVPDELYMFSVYGSKHAERRQQ
jgi:hypothetical protein